MRYIIILVIIFSIPLVHADTTFFDNPDDVFIMSDSSTTGGTTGQVAGGTSESGGCKYDWNCTSWDECFQSGKQTRNCTNIGTCSDTYKTPETEQTCVYDSSKSDEEEETKEGGRTKITGGIIIGEILNKNRAFTSLIIFLIILSIIYYLKKKHNKKLTKKFETPLKEEQNKEPLY